ncbi:MAG: response regulator [Sphingobacteriaceae bacterium]|nr:MAG: response regulator [Sphingobacteriaceae bacterium]
MSLLKTVALIDDDPIYTSAFKNLLLSWQIKNPFLFFNNGKEMLDFMLIKEASALPDILLLDVNMPVMNGWSFLENFAKIRQQIHKNISIYLVSSSIWEDDLQRASNHMLVRDFISKPIYKDKLLDILG